MFSVEPLVPSNSRHPAQPASSHHRHARASVNAPFSLPNSSDSASESGSAEQFTDQIRIDQANYARWVREAGVKLD